jgi:CheY-like chemotaxis protein
MCAKLEVSDMRSQAEIVINHSFGGGRQFLANVNEEAGDDTAHARLERARNECYANLVKISADLASAEATPAAAPAPALARDKLQMLQSMDPDLRTPLHAVLGYAQMLYIGGNLTNQQSKWVIAILNAGKHLLERIHDAVSLANSASDQGAWHIDESGDAPARTAMIGHLTAASSAPIASASSTGEPRALRVLVADDIAMNRDIASQFIRAAGHNVVTAENGVQAVAAATSADFDVILMDVRMPEMDGLEATRKIRVLEGRRGRVPIVALTAMAFQSDVEDCRAAGMSGHLAKPFRYETLNEAVRLGAAARQDHATPAHAGAAKTAPSHHPAAPGDALAAPTWIDINSPWTGIPFAGTPQNVGEAGQYILDTQVKLTLVAVGTEHNRQLVDKKRSCAPPLDRPQHEFHWLLYTDEGVAGVKSFSARCDLWRWSNAAWRNISVPGAQFSPDEMYEHGWRYCGPCVEKTAIVQVE